MQMKLWWFCWLLSIVLTFSALELRGYLVFGVPGTFSHFMAEMGRAWPAWIFLWGLLIGGLGVHFWWAAR